MTDDTLTCPDCSGTSFTASVLGTVGPKETLGLRCESCSRAFAKVTVKSAQSDVWDAIAEVYE